jgi:hypothetical protein
MRTLTQPRALATRDKILQEATRWFAVKGDQATKPDEILRAIVDVDSHGVYFFDPPLSSPQ